MFCLHCWAFSSSVTCSENAFYTCDTWIIEIIELMAKNQVRNLTISHKLLMVYLMIKCHLNSLLVVFLCFSSQMEQLKALDPITMAINLTPYDEIGSTRTKDIFVFSSSYGLFSSTFFSLSILLVMQRLVALTWHEGTF